MGAARPHAPLTSTPHHPHRRGVGHITDETEPQMIRHQAIQATEADQSDLEDGSMRVIEYAIAFVALVVAGILAFIR
jgi:hypothetical protein